MTALSFDPDEVGRRFGEDPPPAVRRNGHARPVDPEPYDPEAVDDAGATPARAPRRLYSLADLANLTSAAEDYVIGGGLLTRKGKLLAYAPPGKGKTTFADHLGACLASGRHFLGRFPIDRPYRVLMIQAELAESELASHGQALLQTYGATAATTNLEFLLDSQMRLPRHRDELRALIHERGIEIIGLDPALEFFEGESSDKAEQVGKMLTAIDWILEQEEQLAGAIVIHHQNVAGGRTSGSWKFEGWPSTILRLEPVPGIPSDRKVVFEKVRAPGFTVPEKLQIRLGEAGYLPIAGEAKIPEGRTELVVLLLREAGGQLSRKDLVDRVAARAKVKDRAAIGYIAQAKQEGAVVVHQAGREAVYRLGDDMAVAAALVLHTSAQEPTSA